MKNNNQINVPQAREAMDKFKMQAASEVGVNLAGSVGGQMVKNECPRMTKLFVRKNRTKEGHSREIQYILQFAI